MIVLIVFFGLGIPFVCNAIGVVPAAYYSLSSLESMKKGGHSDGERKYLETQWLSYWVIFAAFSVIETYKATILYIFPMYYAVKVRAAYV